MADSKFLQNADRSLANVRIEKAAVKAAKDWADPTRGLQFARLAKSTADINF